MYQLRDLLTRYHMASLIRRGLGLIHLLLSYTSVASSTSPGSS